MANESNFTICNFRDEMLEIPHQYEPIFSKTFDPAPSGEARELLTRLAQLVNPHVTRIEAKLVDGQWCIEWEQHYKHG